MKERPGHMQQLIRLKVDLVDSNAEVILYGSQAMGEEKSDSDWDIIILTNYPVDSEVEDRFRDKMFDLELETGELISTFIYYQKYRDGEHHITPFYHNVLAEDIKL